MKVIYLSHQEYFFELGKILHKRLSWNPVYWLTDKKVDDLIKNQFPDTYRFDYLSSIKGKIPSLIEKFDSIKIEKSVFRSIAKNKYMIFGMMDRNDSLDTFSNNEKEELLKRYIKIWKTIIDITKPDIVLFEEEPHQASDYILYLMCEFLNLKKYLFRRAFFQDRIFAVSKFEVICSLIKRNYEKDLKENNPEVSPFLEFHFDSLRSKSYSKVELLTLWNVDEYKKEDDYEKFIKFFKTFKDKIVFVYNILSGNFSNDQKQKGIPLYKSKMGYFEQRRMFKHTRMKNERLLKFYNEISLEPSLNNEKYIFFPFQYQPERTTNPIGGHFFKHERVVKMILEILPKDWFLYLKEHPRQFSKGNTRYGNHGRSKSFYTDFIKTKRVKFISLKIDSHQLLDNSLAVATISGSTGWEAVARGKNTLLFGHAWYKGCEGVHFIESKKDLEKTFKLIKQKNIVDLKKVEIFGKSLENTSFVGAVGGPSFLEKRGVNIHQNAEAHFEALENILKLS